MKSLTPEISDRMNDIHVPFNQWTQRHLPAFMNGDVILLCWRRSDGKITLMTALPTRLGQAVFRELFE